MPGLALYLLGPPRIERDGVPVHVPRRKVIAFLAYLAVTGRRHSRDTLATLFWPEHDQRQARGRLRRALSSLNRALGQGWEEGKQPLDVERESVGLNRDAEIWSDVAAFRGLLTKCRAHRHPQGQTCRACLSLLGEAAALYGDDLMAGFSLRDSPGFDNWQFFQAQGLRDQLANTLRRLAEGHGSLREYEPAIAHARRWAALDPLHEPAHRCLMRLYARSGQRAVALRQYAECERVLQDELGMPPQEETARLYRTIVEGTDPLPRVEQARAPVVVRKHNLPLQLTPFVGRKALLAQIADSLQQPACRLLTLVGPGGSGKTRLALQAAAEILSGDGPFCYPDGVYLISLAALDSAKAIVPAVADAIGFSFYAEEGRPQPASPERQLLDHLRGKAMLLILDNVEHVLAEHSLTPGGGEDVNGAGLMTEILKAAPQVRILATSRARLNVQGEHLLPVGGMDFPRPTSSTLSASTDIGRYGAARLFLQGARRVRPGFELTAANQADVVRICRLVDGLPLGILLAAAWVSMLTPAQIAAQIRESFDFLTTDLHDVPARQRSMRAVFDHSWNLLTARGRAAMRALSVFRGGFTRQAAQRVTGATLRELRTLIDQSLLEWTGGPEGRYEMHELLRQYAAEKLGEVPAQEEAARDRHCSYYAGFLQQREAGLVGWNQKDALAEIEAEIDNVRAAWDWAVAQVRIEDIDRSLGGLAEFYYMRARFYEGEEAFARAAEMLARGQPDVGSRPGAARRSALVLGRVLARLGRFCDSLGLVEKASERLRESLDILSRLDARREMAYALSYLGDVHAEQGKLQYQEALVIFREIGDQRGVATSLRALGHTLIDQGEYGAARQLIQESLDLFRALGNPQGIAYSLRRLGYITWALGEYGEAKRLYQESYALFRDIGDRAGMAISLAGLARDACGLEEYGEGKRLYRESLDVFRDIGSLAEMSIVLGDLSELANVLGEYDEGRQLAQESLGMFEKLDYPIQKAWAFRVLGNAACGLGDYEEARRYFRRALETRMLVRATAFALLTLVGIANLLAREGKREWALELLALVLRHPSTWQWTKDRAAPLIAELEVELSPDLFAAVQERGWARDLEVTVKELLAELATDSPQLNR